MRILHVVPTYLPATRYGGPIFAVHGLCRALAARGHKVTVFTTNVDGPNESDVPIATPIERDGVQVRYFRSQHLRRLFWAPEMGRALERHAPEYDLLQLHSVFLWPTAKAASVARRLGLPYVITPHGMLRPELIRLKSRLSKTVWLRLVERQNLERAAAIHVTTSGERIDLERLGYRLPRVFVVPFGIDDSAPASTRDPSPAVREATRRRPLVVSVGRVNWKKGLDRLVIAMKHVPGAFLAIAGNDDGGELERLHKLVRAEGLTGRVQFTGPVLGSDKAELFAAGDVFVLPSHSENLGIVVLEALAAGMPVVVTPNVGLASDVQECGAGLVSEGEPERLGRAINRLLQDSRLRSEMGARGRRMVAERFNWDSIARRMEDEILPLVRTACPQTIVDRE